MAVAGRARARFQSGLLAWLRAPEDPAGLREMIAVLRLLAGDDEPARRILWRSAEAFLAAILAGGQPVDAAARTLCRRIERQLAASASGDLADAAPLREALFAFVSRKLAGGAPETAPAPQLNSLLGGTLGRTAELLPLIAGAVRPRYPAERVAAWHAQAASLAEAWQALYRSADAEPCRRAATALVASALALNDPGCLRLAEALAAACALGEDARARAQPVLRAAVAAGLEIAAERDGPNHPQFARRVELAATRLDQAGRQVTSLARIARSDRLWYVDEAREVVGELRAALHAVPPDAVALSQGADWFGGADAGAGQAVAVRGLASLIAGLVRRAPVAALDTSLFQETLGRSFDALERALDEIAEGHPPAADERVFAELRRLSAETGR